MQDLELQSKTAIKPTEDNHQLLQNTSFSSGKQKLTRNFGNCLAFCFCWGEPLFTIGPHCNFFVN